MHTAQWRTLKDSFDCNKPTKVEMLKYTNNHLENKVNKKESRPYIINCKWDKRILKECMRYIQCLIIVKLKNQKKIVRARIPSCSASLSNPHIIDKRKGLSIIPAKTRGSVNRVQKSANPTDKNRNRTKMGFNSMGQNLKIEPKKIQQTNVTKFGTLTPAKITN